MVNKRKGRSVKRNKQTSDEPDEVVRAPHSFVIHRGLPGASTGDLTKDFRKVMEPFTASNLKERKKNAIKDFVSVSGLLHVSHMCIFTRTDLGMYLKIAKLPRGPTLSFKIHNFTLARDVVSSLKKQYVYSEVFKHSPLLVLNSFSGEGMQMKLLASTFQNMFPTINLTNVNLSNIRRCVLLNYNPTSKLIEFRHYAIKVIPVGISKGVKKVVQGKVPNLSRCNDISEFLSKSGILSESEFEDDPSHRVTLPQKLTSRGNLENMQSAIRLSELGPRLTLQLIKVEDGLLDGEVLYHELVHKTEEEIETIRKKREEKRKLKEHRKKQQELNTKKKLEKKEDLKQKSLKGMQKQKTESDQLMKQAAVEANKEVQVDDDDDVEYYRQEVGEEPEKELFSASTNRKRSFPEKPYKNKKPRLDDKPASKFNKDRSKPHKKFKSSPAKQAGQFDKKHLKSHKKTDSLKGKKWPGGRGGNPKYGFKAQENDNSKNLDKKSMKVVSSKAKKTKNKKY